MTWGKILVKLSISLKLINFNNFIPNICKISLIFFISNSALKFNVIDISIFFITSINFCLISSELRVLFDKSFYNFN